MAQTVGLEAVRWIEEVKERCGTLGGQHGWIWPYSGITKPLGFPNLPLLEGQGSIMAGSDDGLDCYIPEFGTLLLIFLSIMVMISYYIT